MKTLNRRHFLGGLGAATGLASSFFNSSVALGQTDEAPTRLLLIALQHGWGKDRTLDAVITGTEFDFRLPSFLSPFNAIKDRCVFVDGVRGSDWGNAHDVSYSDIFTAAVPWGETGSSQLGSHFPEPIGPSLDWVLGQHHNKQVLRVSARYGSWGRVTHPMCFDDRFRELPSYKNAQAAYDAVVTPLMESAVPVEPGRAAVRNALFDYLGEDAQRLLQRVDGEEQRKLEGYLESFNALGDRILNTNAVGLGADEIPDRPEPYIDGSTLEREIENSLELIRLVFKADSHRVAVLGIGDLLNEWPWIDQNGDAQSGSLWGDDFHHLVAHYDSKSDGDHRLAYEGWVSWNAQKVVEFAQSLSSTPDIDGRSLLDNTLIMLTGEVGTGSHDRRDKMHILIGGGGGIRQGRWITTPQVEPRARNGAFLGGQTRDGTVVTSTVNYGETYSLHHTADLLVSIARLAGVPLESFGIGVNNLEPIALV
ncbi:MAG: DUF1552 domain-containing protein [Myxococcota bacterium]